MKQYKEAKVILEKVKSARRILLALHRSPDADSVGSNLALFQILKKLGKTNVEIISPDGVPKYLSFLPYEDKIKEEDVAKKEFSKFDLFIALDSSSTHMLTREVPVPTFPDTLKIIVIDHHVTNTKYGQINLIDDKVSSTSELLFNLAHQWNVELDKDIATCLLTGIAGDTGTFRWVTTKDTISAASVLLEHGADLSEINFNLYQRVPIESFKFAAKVFAKIELAKAGKYNFVWAAVPVSDCVEKEAEKGSPFSTITLLKSIEGVDFAILITEEQEGAITGSLRSRTGFDVSKIAVALGGGGHKSAAGFAVRGEFNQSIAQILETIKRVVGSK